MALDLGAYKSDNNQLPLLDEDQQKLQEAKSIDSAFIMLRQHMSFFNYEILSHIINHLGSKQDQENLAKYCSQFEVFCERKVFEVPPNVFDPNGCGQKRKDRKLFVVLGTEYLFQNLNNVKAAQRRIASLLGLRVSTLQLKRIDFGSIILVFSVPTSLEDLFPLDASTYETLKSIGFTLIIPDTLSYQEDHYITGIGFDQKNANTNEAPTLSSDQDNESSLSGRSASTPEDRLRNLCLELQKLGTQDDTSRFSA